MSDVLSAEDHIFEKASDKTEYDAIVNTADVRTDIKIGGTTEKFVPNINMRKWDDEAWLNINHPGVVGTEKETFQDDMIIFPFQDFVFKYYLHKQYENDGLEYEIEIPFKPSVNIIESDLAYSPNLQFYKTPSLEEEWEYNKHGYKKIEDLKRDVTRNEFAINSYKAYISKRNNQYKKGKFCTIFRPKLIDKDGHWIWCDQNISGNKWFIILPEEFLKTAIYPLKLDPYIGYSTPGTDGSHGVVGQYRGSNDITDGNGGEIKRFHCAVASVDAVNKNLKICVANCAQGDGDPSNGVVIEQIEFEVDVGDDEWADAAGGNNVSPDTKYYIAFAVPDADTKIKYDILPGCWYDWGIDYASVFPDPLEPAHTYSNAVRYSIWVDYEAPPVADPIFDPVEGEYIDFVDVTITCATEGATIKYTTDGSTPTPTHGTEYTEPVHITETTTLKAIAYKTGMSDSNVVSGLYTIKELWREIIEFDSPITKKIEFDSPITKEIEFDSPITKIIEFDSEVNNG